MSTFQAVINRGIAKSSAARIELLATNELLDRAYQCLQEAFAVFSRERPDIIGTTALLNFDGTGWPRPADALRVIRVVATAATQADPVIASGRKITVVPFDDPLVAAGKPSLMEYGQKYLPAGQSIDPSGGSLLCYYARMATRPATVNDNVDPFFPLAYDSFLEYDIAAFAAEKDKRLEDLGNFNENKNGQLALMVEWARAQTYEITQRHALTSPPTANTAGGRQQPLKDVGE